MATLGKASNKARNNLFSDNWKIQSIIKLCKMQKNLLSLCKIEEVGSRLKSNTKVHENAVNHLKVVRDTDGG